MEIIKETAIGLGQILLICLVMILLAVPLDRLQRKFEAKYSWGEKLNTIVGLIFFIVFILLLSYGIGSGKLK